MSPSFRQGLTEPRRQLVRLMQEIQFGKIEGLVVKGGQPVLEPLPEIVREYKFGGDNESHPGLNATDFLLKSQVVDLLRQVDLIGDGLIQVLEVKHGLPFRMFVNGGRPSRAR